MFDSADLAILAALQSDARVANAEIARQLDMAPSAILERIRKLEQRGVIEGYTARLAPRACGFGLTAFVSVGVEGARTSDALGPALAAIPEVLEVHQVVGDDCFLLKLRARDTDDLARLLNQQIKPIKGITHTRTTIVLATAKEHSKLPLAAVSAPETGR